MLPRLLDQYIQTINMSWVLRSQFGHFKCFLVKQVTLATVLICFRLRGFFCVKRQQAAGVKRKCTVLNNSNSLSLRILSGLFCCSWLNKAVLHTLFHNAFAWKDPECRNSVRWEYDEYFSRIRTMSFTKPVLFTVNLFLTEIGCFLEYE